jgi:hypothetical protein
VVREQETITHHLGLLEEAGVRAQDQQAEIERLARLVEASAVREQETIIHHLGLVEEAAARAQDQQIEIGQLSAGLKEAAVQAQKLQARIDELGEALGRSEAWARILEGETALQDARIASLVTLVERCERRIAFQDDKIAWLALDRERFRTAHAKLIGSRLWRLTRPLQGSALRDAIRARPLVRALPPDSIAETTYAPPTHPGPVATAPITPALPPVLGEVPDRARWIQARLYAA